MSGWWHPEGPESVATYWSRRVIVIAAAVLALVLAVVLVTTGAQGSEPTGTATPAAPTAPPASSSPPSPTPTPSSSATSSPIPSGSATADSTASDGKDSAGKQSTGKQSTGKTSGSPSSSASSTARAKPTVTACDPTRLRATLQGDPTPKVGQRVVFTLSLINGNNQPCTLKRNADTVELKVYSGTDRIWSTADCAKLVRPVAHLLKPEAVVSWKLAWSGARSAKGCATRPETPRAGTYFATFQYAGAKPVQQRMLLSAS